MRFARTGGSSSSRPCSESPPASTRRHARCRSTARSVTFFITTTSGGEGGDQAAVSGDEFAQRRVNSYLGLLSTDRLADQGHRVVGPRPLARAGQGHDRRERRPRDGADHRDGDLGVARSGARRRGRGRRPSSSTSSPRSSRPSDGTSTVNLELVSGPNVGEVPPRTEVTIGLRAPARPADRCGTRLVARAARQRDPHRRAAHGPGHGTGARA